MAKTTTPRTYKQYDLSGSPTQKITQGLKQNKFTKVARKIAIAMSESWPQTAHGAATRLAEQAGCDKASVTRFITCLGYANHNAFKLAVQAELGDQAEPATANVAEMDDNDTRELLGEIAELEYNAKSFILNFNPVDLERFADHLKPNINRLFRAKRIGIIAATPGARPWLPVVQDLFASRMTIEVSALSPDERLAQHADNILIILHEDTQAPPSINAAPATEDKTADGWWRAGKKRPNMIHFVIGSKVPEWSGSQRVFHLNDGSDRTAGLMMMINICSILINRVLEKKSAQK